MQRLLLLLSPEMLLFGRLQAHSDHLRTSQHLRDAPRWRIAPTLGGMRDGCLEERRAAAASVTGRMGGQVETGRAAQLSGCASAPNQQLLLLKKPWLAPSLFALHLGRRLDRSRDFTHNKYAQNMKAFLMVLVFILLSQSGEHTVNITATVWQSSLRAIQILTLYL